MPCPACPRSSRVGPHARMSTKQHTAEYCMFPSFRLEGKGTVLAMLRLHLTVTFLLHNAEMCSVRVSFKRRFAYDHPRQRQGSRTHLHSPPVILYVEYSSCNTDAVLIAWMTGYLQDSESCELTTIPRTLTSSHSPSSRTLTHRHTRTHACSHSRLLDTCF